MVDKEKARKNEKTEPREGRRRLFKSHSFRGGALFRNLGRSTQKIGHFKLTISTEAIIFLMIFR